MTKTNAKSTQVFVPPPTRLRPPPRLRDIPRDDLAAVSGGEVWNSSNNPDRYRR
jgi:hypothetical protein